MTDISPLTRALSLLKGCLSNTMQISETEALVQVSDANRMMQIFDDVERNVGKRLDCTADVKRPGYCILIVGPEAR